VIFSYYFSDFGDNEISTLVNHFAPVLGNAGIDRHAVEVEWDLLKTVIYSK
jgi:hypothetical protein